MTGLRVRREVGSGEATPWFLVRASRRAGTPLTGPASGLEVELIQAEVPRGRRRREPGMAPWQALWTFPPGRLGRKGQRAGGWAAAGQLHEP